MAGLATMTKLCSFTQTLAGCDISDPENPVPVMLVVMVDAAGNPIPTDSTSYPVGDSGFIGDGSGFIRSYHTDMALTPKSGVVFSAACCGPTAPNTDDIVHRIVPLLGGKVIATFGDIDETTSPTATLTAGRLKMVWGANQTPHSLRFIGTPADLLSNEFTIENSGGKDAANHSQSDATGLWPFIAPQRRSRISLSQPFEQTPEDAGDSLNIYQLPIITAGVTEVRMEGFTGDFGFQAIY